MQHLCSAEVAAEPEQTSRNEAKRSTAARFQLNPSRGHLGKSIQIACFSCSKARKIHSYLHASGNHFCSTRECGSCPGQGVHGIDHAANLSRRPTGSKPALRRLCTRRLQLSLYYANQPDRRKGGTHVACGHPRKRVFEMHNPA